MSEATPDEAARTRTGAPGPAPVDLLLRAVVRLLAEDPVDLPRS